MTFESKRWRVDIVPKPSFGSLHRTRTYTFTLKLRFIGRRDNLPPYHIIITRKNQVLLSFLKIRVVINGKEIYPLSDCQPVRITVDQNHPKLVVTDGYHFTKPVELIYHHLNTYYFKVICVIDDVQILAGSLLLISLYLLGFYTGVFAIKLFSFAPIVYFLFFYFINRKEFIQITPV